MNHAIDRTFYLQHALAALTALIDAHGPACVCWMHHAARHAETELGQVQLIVAAVEERASCGSKHWRAVLEQKE